MALKPELDHIEVFYQDMYSLVKLELSYIQFQAKQKIAILFK